MFPCQENVKKKHGKKKLFSSITFKIYFTVQAFGLTSPCSFPSPLLDPTSYSTLLSRSCRRWTRGRTSRRETTSPLWRRTPTIRARQPTSITTTDTPYLQDRQCAHSTTSKVTSSSQRRHLPTVSQKILKCQRGLPPPFAANLEISTSYNNNTLKWARLPPSTKKKKTAI